MNVLEAWAVCIVLFQSELIIINFGGNDMCQSSVPVEDVVAQSFAQDSGSPAVIFICLDDHSQAVLAQSGAWCCCALLYNLHLGCCHDCVEALPQVDPRINFQQLFGFNGSTWFQALTDRVYLFLDAQRACLKTIQYAIHMTYCS